jgi:hypothetical protein
LVDVALANAAHLDGIPANGSPGPQLLADLFNEPIEEMRAAKEAEVELPECLKCEATAEETARIAQHQGRLTRARADRPQDAAEGRGVSRGRAHRGQEWQ